MHPDRPLLGIALMTGFCLLAPLGDSIAKLLGGLVPLLVLLTVRFVIQAGVLVPVAMLSRMSLRMSRRALLLCALRSLLHAAGIGLMFSALRYLPLADAVAIAFVMPFLMLLLGKYVLGEAVGAHRLLACCVGFIGTLMVIRPAFADVGAAALLPLGVAFVFALFMMIGRQLAREVAPITLQAVSGLMASGVLVPMALVWLWLGDGWAWPGARESWLLLAMGLIGTLAHLLMTWSLRFAPAATLAPMEYLEIPFATAMGWLIFGDLPDGMAAAGICVTIIAGLYVVVRERHVARELSRPPAPPPTPPAPPAV